MDEQVVVICPHCGFSRSVAKGVIPQGTTQATCPKCKQSFALQAEVLVSRAEPTPQPAGMNPPPEPPADYAAAPVNPEPMRPRNLHFVFHGTAGECFGIWIVNALLKLVTLGCYTAWAKVRQRRFFYGNTTLHGETFEYTADPWALFKGWLIGAGAFLLYMIGGSLSPVLGAVIGLILFLCIPWLVVSGHQCEIPPVTFTSVSSCFQAYLIFAAGVPHPHPGLLARICSTGSRSSWLKTALRSYAVYLRHSKIFTVFKGSAISCCWSSVRRWSLPWIETWPGRPAQRAI
jgi:hypothetical protein